MVAVKHWESSERDEIHANIRVRGKLSVLSHFRQDCPTADVYNSKTVRPTALKNRKIVCVAPAMLPNGENCESSRRSVPE